MTRSEALEILDHNWTRLVNPDYTDEELGKAQNMAIEALEQCEMAYEHGWTDAESKYREILERKHGEWIERNVTQDRRDAKIPEWQSAKCSVCGKYHTTPYMYYFRNYDYCPTCGADMRERREDERNI